MKGPLFPAGVILIMCFVHSAQAHLGDRIFPIYEISDEDLMEIDVRDGSIEDWEEIVGEPSVHGVESISLPWRGEDLVPLYDPSEFDFRIWLGWNDRSNLLLFGIETVDDEYVNEYVDEYPDGNIFMMFFRNDVVSFLVDGDHSGGEYNRVDPAWTDEEKKLNIYRTAQTYFAIAEAPDGRYVGYLGAGEDWVNVQPYTDGGGRAMGESPTVSVIEFFVTPFDDLIWDSPDESKASELFPGKIIGFDIQVVDHDSAPGGAFFSLSGDFNSIFDAGVFVDGLLIGKGGTESDDTVVESKTWGRIKASFR